MQDTAQLERMFAEADEIGFRMELVGGIPTWELSPSLYHGATIDRIRATILRGRLSQGCDCAHFADILSKFPDNSLKRPDISVFCHRPELVRTALTVTPDAVIEIISEDYEQKNWEVSVPFYLAQKIKDVVVFDPETNLVAHFQDGKRKDYPSPIALVFVCGCTCTV